MVRSLVTIFQNLADLLTRAVQNSIPQLVASMLSRSMVILHTYLCVVVYAAYSI